MTTLLVATTNPGKCREIGEVLDGFGLELRTLADHPGLPVAIEDAETFAGNALKKAEHYARLTGLLTLADDSGLEVDALGGRPGVHSARFAGPEQDDAANNARLVRELAGVPPEERAARFRCAIVILGPPDTALCSAEGTLEGRIVDDPRGANGFGYDPHFLLPDLGLTSAELEPEHKNRISHRGQALRAAAERLTGPLERWIRDAQRL